MGGTCTFTRQQKGAYMDLLMAQFNQIALTIEDIRLVLGSDFDLMWETKLKAKFETESNGLLYFNRKMRDEVIKRKAFTESRKNNKAGKNQHTTGHMTNHMGSHMENEDEDVNAVKDNIKTKNTTTAQKPKKITAFVRDNPPTIEECTPYCLEKGIDPQQFHDANTAVGWVDKNKTPYRDWKAVVRKWANYRKATAPVVAAGPSKRPAAIVVLEKIAVGMDDRAIMQALVGTYSEHAISEALMHARGKVQ